MMDSDTGSDSNVRAPRYWIARTEAPCWHCLRATPLVSLALPPGHYALDGDADAENAADAAVHGAEAAEAPGDVWHEVAGAALLFYVEHLPASVRQRLAQISPCYRLAFSEPTAGNYWANHCSHCDAMLEDHELFCEPDGAFLPTSEAAAAAIHLLSIEEAFEAAAGGYATEPQFFDSLSRS